MNKYDSYSVTEEMIERAEKFFGINNEKEQYLEAFTVNKLSNRVLMNVSTGDARKDIPFADLISARMIIEGITFTKSGRDVVIATEDFMKLFGEED